MTNQSNIAFKVTWVEGADGPFTGPCIPEIRALNVKRRRWCGQPQNACYKATNSNRPVSLDYPCNDVKIFENWQFSGGWYHAGERKGHPIPLLRAKPGKLAFFTTRFPGKPEKDRIVIGCYRVASLEQRDGEFWVTSQRSPRLRVYDLMKAPKFWRYYRQSYGPFWGSGLFRYMTDSASERLYEAVRKAAS